MRKLVLSLFAVALFAAPALAGEFNKKVSVGQKAPDISGIEAFNPQNGETSSLNLGDIKDDVTVVVFLANHCPVVIAYEDRIQEFTDAYKAKGVKVVAIATSGKSTEKADNLDAIKARAKDGKFNYVYGYDKSQDIGRSYGATNTPQFFVLDKDKTIRYMGAMDDNQNEGKVTKQYLRDAVDALLAGKEVSVKETRAVGCGIQYNAN